MEIRNFGQSASEEVITYPHGSVRLVNGVAEFLHADQLGSVKMVTDSAGLKASQNSYKPFGEIDTTVHNAAVEAETKGFIGERYDSDAGLQYLNARYYDPELGIFVQPDWWEIQWSGGGTNRFSYAFNDPVNLNDPNGNAPDYGYGTPRSYYTGERGPTSNESETRSERHAKHLAFVGLSEGTAGYQEQSASERANHFDQLSYGYREAEIERLLHYNPKAVEALRKSAVVGSFAIGVGEAVVLLRGGFYVVRGGLQGVGRAVAGGANSAASLISPSRARHTLYGDKTGGGNKWGLTRIFNGRSKFPIGWSDERILQAISDAATNPLSKRVQQTGKQGALTTRAGKPVKYRVDGAVDGINIRVKIQGGSDIFTGFPI